MGDNLACPDMVAGARRLEDLGCGYIVHHIGYDERRGIAARGERMPSPLDDLRAVGEAVSVPIQAVGGLSIEQAVQCPAYGAPPGRPGSAIDDRCGCFQNRRRRSGSLLAFDLREGACSNQG